MITTPVRPGARGMAAGLQVAGLLLGLVSWCLQSSCTSSQVWKVRSQQGTVGSGQWQYEGLWMSCAATSLGSVQCSRFKTLLGLPRESGHAHSHDAPRSLGRRRNAFETRGPPSCMLVLKPN